MRTTERLQAPRNLAKDESGAIAIMGAGALIMLLLVLGLVIDFGFAFNMRNQLQRAADSAALAGASQLGNDTNVFDKANEFAEFNMPAAAHGDVLADVDIEIGNWDTATRVFTAGGNPENAVRVTTRRTAATGNAVPSFIGGLAGIASYSLSTAAVAVNAGPTEDCLGNGFIAMGKVYSGSQNVITDGFCIHGEEGVKVGSQNEFHPGVEISMPNLADLEQGSDNNNVPPNGLNDALEQRSLIPEDALRIGEIMNELQNGTFQPLPDYLNGTIQHVQDLPANPVAGTLYVVDNVVDFGSGANVEGFGVIGRKEVKVGSDSTVKNALLASYMTLDIGSNVYIGDSTFCDTHNGEVFLASPTLVKTGSNVDIVGAQIITGDLGDFGSDLVRYTSVSVQAAGDIKVGSQLQLSGCPVTTDDHLLLVSGDIRPRLVD